ncbi:MAG: TonB family protein [Acidobacteriota bacterium]
MARIRRDIPRTAPLPDEDDRRVLRACFVAAVLVHGAVLLLPAPWSDASAAPEPPPRTVYRVQDFRLPEPEPPPAETPPPPREASRSVPVPELLVDEPPREPTPLPDPDLEAPAEVAFAIPDVPGPPPSEPEDEGPVHVVGEVVPPEPVHTPRPRYPEIARRAGRTGTVIVQATIDREGTVTDVEVLRGAPLGMTEAAVEAVRRWRFRPATREGRPVAVYYQLTVRFQAR